MSTQRKAALTILALATVPLGALLMFRHHFVSAVGLWVLGICLSKLSRQP